MEPVSDTTRSRRTVAILLTACVLGGATCVWLGWALLNAHKRGNEAAAIGALKKIAAAQGRFREQDLDGDGARDFGTLAELGQADLIDEVLAFGTKQGYRFEVLVPAGEPGGWFLAVAYPVKHGETGWRSYAVREDGRVMRSEERIPLAPDGSRPASCEWTGW